MGDLVRRRRVVICGAGGRDFHDFNRVYREAPEYEVVAFTAAQIPGIAGRLYPPSLAGALYPAGIAIVSETELEALIASRAVDEVVFAYSDVSHDGLMLVGSRVLAAGANFSLLGPAQTMIRSRCPVVAVSAVRTGCGKSQIARYLSRELTAAGHRVAVVRHPMPYGDLARQSVQRFASLADMDAADCSLEEREEYEPHVAAGGIVFAGVDYAAVAAAAEREADVLLWDGGNNDFPFLLPDFHIVVVDALRPEQIDTHYPGGAVLRMADLVVINKALSADATTVRQLRERLIGLLPAVPVMAAGSPVTLSDPAAVRGRRVLVVEDGPTITHGGMPHGAGYAAVRDMADVTLINPRDCAVGEIAETFRQYPHIGPVLPALGYSVAQRKALQQTIEASGAEVVVTGTPIDLNRVVPLSIPVVRARYEYAEIAGQTPQEPGLAQRVLAALAGWTPGKAVAPA